MENEIKVGTEVIFDGMTWGIVDEITEDGTFIVIDQDGGDHELHANRIDAIL